MKLTTTILLDGLTFPECPRWHDGALWFSDVHAHKIMRLARDGRAEAGVENAHQPAGLGWLPNGNLLYVRMVDRTLVRVSRGEAQDDRSQPPPAVPATRVPGGRAPSPVADGADIVADLSSLEAVQINDMTVSAEGRAYVGGFGFDINKGEPFAVSSIMMVDLSAGGRAPSPVIAADSMRFPNGMVITPDGRTLIAAETAGRCLTAFDIAADGTLSSRREWAPLGVFPDGICLDADGAIWVASPTSGECLRVREGGEVTHTVKAHAKGVYACMLGGAEGRTLYLCTANTTGPELAQGISTGWIESVEVEIPHAGLP